jgi:hypothetical protein
MGRTAWTALGGALALLLAGCATGPLHENPVLLQADAAPCGNPVYLPYGPQTYGLVFERVLDVVSDYFEVAYSNRYDGRIETFPRTAPGLGQPWKPGSPDLYQRLLATFQSMRHRAVVLIEPARQGGYYVDVKVYKELEDLDRPGWATAGAAIFRSDNVVERQYEVIDAGVYEVLWIPVGRDEKFEQAILDRIAHFQPTDCPPAWRNSLDRFTNGLWQRPVPPPEPIPSGPVMTTPTPMPSPTPPPILPAPRTVPGAGGV